MAAARCGRRATFALQRSMSSARLFARKVYIMKRLLCQHSPLLLCSTVDCAVAYIARLDSPQNRAIDTDCPEAAICGASLGVQDLGLRSGTTLPDSWASAAA